MRKCQESKILGLDRKVSFEKFDYSSHVKFFPQTDFTIAFDILFENSLSIVFPLPHLLALHPGKVSYQTLLLRPHFLDTTGNSVEAPLLMSLPSCNKNK